MQIEILQSAAQRLLDAHQARAAFASESILQGQPLSCAYDVQDLFQAGRSNGQKLAGYKIGLTTPRMQQMCGLDHPIAGQILSGGVRTSPVELVASDFVRLGLECELAVRIGQTLDARNGAPSLAAISDAVEGVCAAFEVIEDRAADYSKLDMPSLIADNSWNAGAILTDMSPLPDLSNLRGCLRINGSEADFGSTADVLGHPLHSVQWVATHLATRNQVLEAGQWILTGSIVPTRFPKPGDRYEFQIDGLPAVSAVVV